ncbi:MAG: hypothetical protein AAGA66_08360 [Bacteroidota bacterium]
MKTLNITNILYNLIIAFFIGMLLVPFAGLDSYYISIGILLMGVAYSLFTPHGRESLRGLAFMGLQREIWQDHIQGEIFKNNKFLKHSKKVSAESILGGRVVHIEQSGGSGNVVKNRRNLPAKTRRRQDNDVIYLLNDYTTDPVVIPFTDEKELSPEYRNSVLGEDKDKLIQSTAEDGILAWLSSDNYSSYGATMIPSSNILSSSGEVPEGLDNNPTKTSKRKKTTIDDAQRMRSYFLEIDRWFENKMYALLTPQQEMEMFPANSVITATYMQTVTEEERRKGVMYKAQGWNFMTRSSVVNMSEGGELKVPGEVLANSDDFTSLFWYEEAVEHCVGSIEPFFTGRDASNYGDVFSFMIYSGGRACRKDYKGVALLKQGKPAIATGN